MSLNSPRKDSRLEKNQMRRWSIEEKKRKTKRTIEKMGGGEMQKEESRQQSCSEGQWRLLRVGPTVLVSKARYYDRLPRLQRLDSRGPLRSQVTGPVTARWGKDQEQNGKSAIPDWV